MKFEIINPFRKIGEAVYNKVNQLYFQNIGGGDVSVDFTNTWAIETAFMQNPDVYSILMKMATKTSSVPNYCKKIKSDEAYKSYQQKKSNFLPTTMGVLSELKAQKQTFDKEVYKPLPIERPNPLMGWSEFWQLSKIYLRASGNVFWYVLRNEQNKPLAIYVLPSHLMQIMIKPNAFNLSLETPVLGYQLIYSNTLIPFLESEVIHIKMPNPDWTFDARQLMGMSPLKSAYLNITNQIEANKHLTKMFRSSGAFGFIFAKGEALTPDQAQQFTERIKEMDLSKERMAKISGIAKEIGFQRVSLDNDTLKPWDAMQWDRKTICNVLDWSDELMNNDGKASLSSNETNQARKIVLTDNILPDCLMFEEAFNKFFIKDFKGYEGYKFCFDISEMPEMQDDIKLLMEWADKAPITLNEIRELIKFERLENEGMDDVWISRSKIRLDEAMLTDNFLADIPNEQGTTI
jgi:HK97 family phage portal protein